MNTAGVCGRARLVALALAAALPLAAAGSHPGTVRAATRVGGDFAIERLDLMFVGGEKFKVLAAGQDARAQVEITFRGSGQLGGAWEIAEPTTTAGQPRFRTLELVSRVLGMGRREVLTSPPLPTSIPGAYQLRLRITSPESAEAPVTVRYFVGQQRDGAGAVKPAAPGTLAAHGPPSQGGSGALRFSWQPVTGSIVYQLEFYEKEPAATAAPATAATADEAFHLPGLATPLGRPPLTGIMVPGTQTDVALSPGVAGKLTTGRTYLWRVVALDREGRVVGDSPLKELVR